MTARTITDPELIDKEFSYEGELGVDYSKEESTFRIWAPTASQVKLLFFSNWDQIETDKKYEEVVDDKKAGNEVIENTNVKITDGGITIPAISAVVIYK